MDTIELDDVLSSVSGFIGAFACDQLPPIPKKDFSVVINTDPSNLPGDHWLTLIRKNSVLYFIDSYGRHYKDATFDPIFVKTILKYIGKEKVVCSNKWLQQLTSNTCGYYCVYFIKELLGNSLKRCLSVFGDDLRVNDDYVLNYVKNII